MRKKNHFIGAVPQERKLGSDERKSSMHVVSREQLATEKDLRLERNFAFRRCFFTRPAEGEQDVVS